MEETCSIVPGPPPMVDGCPCGRKVAETERGPADSVDKDSGFLMAVSFDPIGVKSGAAEVSETE